jgi:hypothetical protein
VAGKGFTAEFVPSTSVILDVTIGYIHMPGGRSLLAHRVDGTRSCFTM